MFFRYFLALVFMMGLKSMKLLRKFFVSPFLSILKWKREPSRGQAENAKITESIIFIQNWIKRDQKARTSIFLNNG